MRTASARRMALVMLAPATLALVAVGIFPLGFALVTSFRQYLVTQPGLGTHFVGFENYVTVIQDPVFWGSLGRTGLFYIIAMTLQVLLGVGIALLLDRSSWPRTARVMRVLLVLPIAMTPTVLGLVGRLLFNTEFGIINWMLSLVGIDSVAWLGSPTGAMATIIMIDTWQWTPFVALVTLAGLATVPRDIYEAAAIDTGNARQVLRHIQIPYLLPGLTAVLIIRTADILKLFDMVFVITRGGPGLATDLVSLYVQRTGFRFFDMGVASAQAVLLLVLCIVLSQLFIRYAYTEVRT